MLASQAPEQELDHRGVNEGFGDTGVELIVLAEAAIAPEPAEGTLNGLITNDKFCLTRRGQLQLSWPRARVMGRRVAAAYLPDELSHRGGGHETPVAGAPIHASVGRRPAPLGSGLSAPPAVDDGASVGTVGLTSHGAVAPAGGIPCA
jgi:hypothetical protein